MNTKNYKFRYKRKNKLVISHKDRLIRFGYKLIKNLIKNYSNG